ncbi:MAG TPA: hypothetical protein EYP10_15700 [Armatimonadetes bacterium]|nr:hypothetical protein [Armatimonadota bacterium]
MERGIVNHIVLKVAVGGKIGSHHSFDGIGRPIAIADYPEDVVADQWPIGVEAGLCRLPEKGDSVEDVEVGRAVGVQVADELVANGVGGIQSDANGAVVVRTDLVADEVAGTSIQSAQIVEVVASGVTVSVQ